MGTHNDLMGIQEQISQETARLRHESERQGFDSCLAMLCSMGKADTAVAVLEETERRVPGFKARRQRMRARCDLSKWPELYSEKSQHPEMVEGET